MKLMNQRLKYNLQFHAGSADGDGSDNAGDGDDNQEEQEEEQDDEDSDDKSKKSDKKGKYYTQEDIDDMITKRLERERKKQEKRQKAKDDKKDDKKPDDQSESSKKLSDLETKVLCYDHDIAKEYVKEAIALAKAYMDEDTDMDEALEKVTEKFPQFVKGYKVDKEDEDEEDNEDEDPKKAWGKRQKKSPKKEKTLDDEIEEQLFGKKG